MPLDLQSAGPEDFGKRQPKIAVGEEDNAQAARWYTTACSMSAVVRP